VKQEYISECQINRLIPLPTRRNVKRDYLKSVSEETNKEQNNNIFQGKRHPSCWRRRTHIFKCFFPRGRRVMHILFFPGKHSCLVVRVFLHDCFLRQTLQEDTYVCPGSNQHQNGIVARLQYSLHAQDPRSGTKELRDSFNDSSATKQHADTS
jgi:hypothetical protein